MTTLLIKDLHLAEDLDDAALARVRGGTCYYQPTSWCAPTTPVYCPPVYDPCYGKPSYGQPGNVSLNASQSIAQSQNVVNNNGNNAAFVNGISSTVNPTQSANNGISFA